MFQFSVATVFGLALAISLPTSAPQALLIRNPQSAIRNSQSALKAGDTLPGAFQPLNINGAFAGRYHCLVTEFRLNPVVLVFVRAQADGVDPEVKKLLDALDKAVDDQHNDTGLASFVVFLTPNARSGATEEKTDTAASLIAEVKNREKLISDLKDFSKPFKRLVVTCYPPDNVAKQYSLADAAEVTVLEYARHQVVANFTFAEGKLNQEGVSNVLKGVDDMLSRLKKTGKQ